jgi:hypothetical protein
VSRRARLRRPSCGCSDTGGGGACPRGHRSPWMNGALSRAPHDRSAQNTLARRRGRSNPHAQLAIASSSAGAAYRNPGGPLAVRRQPYKSGDQPVDLDDDHASRAGARVSRSGRPFGTRICRGARADQMAIVKPPLLGRDRVADAAPRLHEVVDLGPAGPSTAETNVPSVRRPVRSVRGGRRPQSPRRPDGGAKPGALFCATGNRRWSHMAPWSTQIAPILQQPKSQSIVQMQGIPGFR